MTHQINRSPKSIVPRFFCSSDLSSQPQSKCHIGIYWQMQRFPPCLRAWVWKNLPSGKGVDVHFELKRWLRGTPQITVNFRRELAKSPACGSNKCKKTSIHITIQYILLLILRASVYNGITQKETMVYWQCSNLQAAKPRRFPGLQKFLHILGQSLWIPLSRPWYRCRDSYGW